MDKITIERETLERAIAYLEAPTAKLWPAGTLHGIAASLRALLAAQPPTVDGHLKCGHHQSLAINSAETGEFLYCDLCDAKSRCRDAEAIEAELRAALAAQQAEPDEQEVALQEIAEFGQDQLREPRTQEEKEQYAFEDWLASECPSGDVESVQRQWEESAEYLELQDATPAQPAEAQPEPVAQPLHIRALRMADMAIASWENGYAFDAHGPSREAQRLVTEALAAQPAEPVAWLHSKTGRPYELEEEVPLADGDEWAEPLYLAAPPQPAPAAWRQWSTKQHDWDYQTDKGDLRPDTPAEPLFVAAAQLVPLTDEQRNDRIEAWSSQGWGDRLGEVVRICIAIERAHGIAAAGDKP